jgi:hypothetical protein
MKNHWKAWSIFLIKEFLEACFGVNHVLHCLSFPQSVERDSRIFSLSLDSTAGMTPLKALTCCFLIPRSLLRGSSFALNASAPEAAHVDLLFCF